MTQREKAHFDLEKVVCRCQNKVYKETKGKIKCCEPLLQVCSSENYHSLVFASVNTLCSWGQTSLGRNLKYCKLTVKLKFIFLGPKTQIRNYSSYSLMTGIQCRLLMSRHQGLNMQEEAFLALPCEVSPQHSQFGCPAVPSPGGDSAGATLGGHSQGCTCPMAAPQAQPSQNPKPMEHPQPHGELSQCQGVALVLKIF